MLTIEELARELVRSMATGENEPPNPKAAESFYYVCPVVWQTHARAIARLVFAEAERVCWERVKRLRHEPDSRWKWNVAEEAINCADAIAERRKEMCGDDA